MNHRININAPLQIFYALIPTFISMAIGMAVIIYAYPKWRQYRQAKRWQVIDAQVTAIAVGFYEEVSEGVQFYVYPKLTYQYVYKGQPHVSKRFAFSIHDMKHPRPRYDDFIGRYEPLRIWWNDLALSDSIQIRVNPNNPNEAIVEYYGNLHRARYYLFVMAFGMAICLFGIWLYTIN